MYANTVNTIKLSMLSLTFNCWKFFFNKKALTKRVASLTEALVEFLIY